MAALKNCMLCEAHDNKMHNKGKSNIRLLQQFGFDHSKETEEGLGSRVYGFPLCRSVWFRLPSSGHNNSAGICI